MSTVILVFNEADSVPLGWKVKVTGDEYRALRQEVATYNSWIDIVSKGDAPESSYCEKEYARELYVAKNPTLQNIFKRPGLRKYYETSPWSFSLVKKKNLEYEVSYEKSDVLTQLLTRPYGDDEVGFGYKVLPTTQKLIK